MNKYLSSSTILTEENIQQDTPTRKVGKIPQRSKYFGHPKAWDKSLVGYHHLKDLQQSFEQQNFHRVALKEVKRALGSHCKHLIHYKTTEGLFFKAKVIVKGELKTFNVDSEVKSAENLTAETYKNLKNVLESAIRS